MPPRKVRSVSPAPRGRSWSETAGAGERDGGAFLGLEGQLGATVALVGVTILILLCPAVVIGMCVPATRGVRASVLSAG